MHSVSDTAVSSHRRRRRTTARGAQQRRRASWARSVRSVSKGALHPAGHRTARQDRWGVADGQRFPRPSPDSTWPGVGRGSDETPRWRRFVCWTGDKQPLHTKMYCYCTINREFLCTSEWDAMVRSYHTCPLHVWRMGRFQHGFFLNLALYENYVPNRPRSN